MLDQLIKKLAINMIIAPNATPAIWLCFFANCPASEELVVPMRLSAFNEGELRNIVYLLTDGPRKIRAIPEEYVVRQVPGAQLLKNDSLRRVPTSAWICVSMSYMKP